MTTENPITCWADFAGGPVFTRHGDIVWALSAYDGTPLMQGCDATTGSGLDLDVSVEAAPLPLRF